MSKSSPDFTFFTVIIDRDHKDTTLWADVGVFTIRLLCRTKQKKKTTTNNYVYLNQERMRARANVLQRFEPCRISCQCQRRSLPNLRTPLKTLRLSVSVCFFIFIFEHIETKFIYAISTNEQ